MSRKYLTIVAAAIVCLLAAAILPYQAANAGGRTTSASVLAVSDGDTLSVMAGRKREKVRLIGIDAPELGQSPWGSRARAYLRELVAGSGNSVALEFDVEKRDQYGRLLAYAWTRDNRLINLEMLRNGYAVLYTFSPNVKYVEQLREAQRYARENGLNVWGRNGLREMPRDYRRTHPR